MARLPDSWRFSLSASSVPENPKPTPSAAVRMTGTLLLGWGLFNVVEGLIDHEVLGVHHVNETVPEPQRLAWDIGFLAWGATMLIGGWGLVKSGLRATKMAR